MMQIGIVANMSDLKDIEGLNARHKDFNKKVKTAFENNVQLSDLKSDRDATDIERLFKIELASKYRDFWYMLDTLKSGDDLYFNTALKCKWIYENEFAIHMNPDYIDNNLLPHISDRNRDNLLTALARNLPSDARAEKFFEYCLEIQCKQIALKFLYITSEEYRLNVANHLFEYFDEKLKIGLKYFVRDSFPVAEAYLLQMRYTSDCGAFLKEMMCLYQVSPHKYLDLLEKYDKLNKVKEFKPLGNRLSKTIMKKYKHRIEINPKLYLKVLNFKVVYKYANSTDARKYIEASMPENPNDFWNERKIRYLMDKIPLTERFTFLKTTFTQKYPSKRFEDDEQFYLAKWYTFMTTKEKEDWAMVHLNSYTELLGPDKNYLWYEFIDFDRAFDEVKTIIMTTTDRKRRIELLRVLVRASTTHPEIRLVLEYFHERHLKDCVESKVDFLDEVTEKFNIFEFRFETWAAYERILRSIGVYEMYTTKTFQKKYKSLAILYHVRAEQSLHPCLMKYLKDAFVSNNSTFLTVLRDNDNKFTHKHRRLMNNYFMPIFSEHFRSYNDMEYTAVTQAMLRPPIRFVKTLLPVVCETVFPAAVKLYADRDAEFNPKVQDRPLNETNLYYLLKKNGTTFKDKLLEVREKYSDGKLVLTKVFRKLRVYFRDDVGKEWKNFFFNILDGNNLVEQEIYNTIYTVFLLGDSYEVKGLLALYKPKTSKIDYAVIDSLTLHKQEAICKFVLYTRPPVTKEFMKGYLKGDYVKYCLPVFEHYRRYLTPFEREDFIEFLMDKPESIHKHGIRMVSLCCDVNQMVKVAKNAWRKTNNVSMRNILYTTLYKKLAEPGNEEPKRGLFNLLLEFTSQLNDDDDREVFECFKNDDLSIVFKSAFLKELWTTVHRLQDKPWSWQRRNYIVMAIHNNISSIDYNFLKTIVDNFMETMFENRGILSCQNNFELECKRNKLKLVIRHLIARTGDVDHKLKVTTDMSKKISELRNEVAEDVYIVRQWYEYIYSDFYDAMYIYHTEQAGRIFEIFLKDVERDMLGHYEMYLRFKMLVLIHSMVMNRDISNNHEKAKLLGKNVALWLKDLIEKGVYFPSIIEEVMNMFRATRIPELDINSLTCRIYFVKGLIEIELQELYIFAVKMLPKSCDRNEVVMWELIDTLKTKGNMEVKCLMQHTFLKDHICIPHYRPEF